MDKAKDSLPLFDLRYPLGMWPMQPDLFDHERRTIALDPGAVLLGGLALPRADPLIAQIRGLAHRARFRHMETRGGKSMSVSMTNCGALGWVSDRSGYRYAPVDPDSGMPWPPIPEEFLMLASDTAAMAGYQNFIPDACLVNLYVPGSRMGMHRDTDERDLLAPIVSVSLGLPATFLWGGGRGETTRRYQLAHGDVVVWGGPSRTALHGVGMLKGGHHPATGAARYNLTLRKAR